MNASLSMKILALVHRVPFPPNKGEKIRAYWELRHLFERGHIIDLATFADVAEDLEHGPELEKFCRKVRIVPKHPKLGRVRSIAALPRAQPLSVAYFHSFRLSRTVRKWLAEERYDAIFCYSSPMAEYVRHIDLPKIMDFVDVDSDKWRQYAEHIGQPMASVYRAEAFLLARYERRVAEDFDASTLVSPAEAETFRRIAPKARDVVAIPNGVDAELFGATVRQPAPASAPVLVFVGQMDYFANVDGVIWFAREIFPKIRQALPGARFSIVGRAPTETVRDLAQIPGVEVTGGVPDVRDYLGSGTIMVAPLRIARGIQNKVLEAMAARIPVVASPAAFEGIEGRHEEHALVAETPEAYAEAVLRLVDDELLAARLVKNARRLVEERYAWGPAMDKLEALIRAKVDAHPSR